VGGESRRRENGERMLGEDRTMVRLERIDKVYRAGRVETLALSSVSLTVDHGEFVVVIGPSGSGKSTLLNIIGLLDVPTRGHVEVDGHDVRSLGDRARSRLRNGTIGFVFQTFHLIPDLSVLDNVEIPLLYRKMSGAERHRACLSALEQVGLGSRRRHHPGELSGGQQQRVAIARAIVGKPRLLLADEPTGNLDSQMGEEIMAVLTNLNREEGTTVVMVTHDPRLAEGAGRTVRLFDGRRVG
jgi:putative ABC transport system ATP-binding protein